MDKISVIVPIYKVEKFLPKCVKSIRCQTYKNLEIILVDDGSPDNCPKLCEEYALMDDRIKVVHKENGGLSSARNAGLDVATGDYITFVDGDDYIEADMYECLYRTLTENECDISVCGLYNVYSHTTIKTSVADEIKVFDNDELMKAFYTTTLIHSSACNKLYKKELWEDKRFPPVVYREDEPIIYKVLASAKRCVHIGDAKYFYIIHANSIERQTFNESMLIYNKTVDDEYEFIKENYPHLEEVLRDYTIKTRIAFLKRIIRSGEMKKHRSSVEEMKRFLKEREPESPALKKTCDRILNHWNLYMAEALIKYKIRTTFIWIMKKVKKAG